ncbi:MAG: hypothetical protein ABI467_08960 [Kofleriaceae bacterium]
MTRRAWIWLGLAIALGVGLGFVPLFGVLGFEHALVVAAFGAICGLDLGASRARDAQRAREAVIDRAGYPVRTLARGVGRACALALAITIVPGLCAAIHGLWAPTCDWGFGLRAFALMPVPSAVFGAAIGHALTIVVGVREDHRWYPHRSTWLAVVAPIVVLVTLGFLRFYREPPVFIYNALIGFFPGNMYDEDIRLGMPLVWSRLEQLATVIAILGVVAARLDVPAYRTRWLWPRPQQRSRWPYVIAPLAAVVALVLHADSGALGYAVDAGDLQAALGGRLETEHFIIYYAQTPEIERDLGLIAEDHEFRYAEVVAEIGAAPEGKLESYYFANTDQKAALFGARNVEMAKPWRHAIYIDHRAFPQPSLRHEIAHVVASAFGDPIFGLAAKDVVWISPGLVEGLAVALDWPGSYDRLTPHEAVRVMQVMGVQPSIKDLLSINFFTVSPARSYQTAGSFLYFLLEKYGAKRMRALYRSGGDFTRAYALPLSELEQQWREMISKIELPADVIEGFKERFRGGSVFARPCPHAIAARRERAMAAAAGGDHARAVSLMREVCSDAPDEPRHRLELGAALASGDPAELAEARALWTAVAADAHVTSTLRAEALEHLARYAGDDATRTALIDRARELPLNADERRQLDAKSFVLHHAGAAAAPLRAYFFGTSDAVANSGVADATAAVAAEPELGLAHYLLGLQKGNAGDWEGSATELDLALAQGLPGPSFRRFASRRLAIGAYRAHRLDLVLHAIAAMRGADTFETDHLLADDWQRRLTFDAQHHL